MSLISPSATVRGISIFAVSVVKIAITNTRFQSVTKQRVLPPKDTHRPWSSPPAHTRQRLTSSSSFVLSRDHPFSRLVEDPEQTSVAQKSALYQQIHWWSPTRPHTGITTSLDPSILTERFEQRLSMLGDLALAMTAYH